MGSHLPCGHYANPVGRNQTVLNRAVKICARPGCGLEALWQIGLSFVPRWTDQVEPIEALTDLCVCGMCAEDVKVSDLNGLDERMATMLTGGHPYALRAEIKLDDISDGKWTDPSQPGKRVPV